MRNDSLSNSRTRNVLIFNKNLIAFSETFIPAQAEMFTTFTPYYVGFGRIQGVKLPDERTLWPNPAPWSAKLRDWGALFGQIDPWLLGRTRKVRPEIVHAHFEFGAIRALPLAERLKVPLIVTCHGVDVTEEAYQWQNRRWLGHHFLSRRKRLFEKASLFVGVSRFICDQMLRRGYPSKKIRLHYIGVDTDKFRPDPTVAKEPTILYVGRLVEKKGSPDLLQAMKKVGRRYPDVKLKIVGNGPLRERLEAFAKEEKLNVQFCGVQPPEVIQQYLKTVLMFCMPSVRAASGDSEGLGIVNLEAQASGIPVVGTLHGGIPECVEHGVAGLLSPEHDPEALADHILTLLSDTGLRTSMGLSARARMLRDFDLREQSRLLENIYLEILGE
jgi:colanic acid/amylovoran biosynthesis glycosyltransferase